ncbi:MAG: phosphatidylserine decarboxylase family protein [Gemmatimonadetes bacterium]|nr:phosphatidylserine decarboxylase family protein [Gemmatimonadota bacterium]
MSVAREGFPFIGIGMVLAVLGWAYAWMRPGIGATIGGVLLTVIAAWVVWFFRDPERSGPRGPSYVIAPADGRVIMIADVDEPAFMQGRATRVSIFMNVFNVHVNRYPVSGTVAYRHYNPGKFLNAAAEKSSLENEQASTGIESGGRRVLVRQIAGLIARRIVTYPRQGDAATQGERMGIIRFGSRVDVFLPVGTPVRVKLDDLTSAGTTVLAEFPR